MRTKNHVERNRIKNFRFSGEVVRHQLNSNNLFTGAGEKGGRINRPALSPSLLPKRDKDDVEQTLDYRGLMFGGFCARLNSGLQSVIPVPKGYLRNRRLESASSDRSPLTTFFPIRLQSRNGRIFCNMASPKSDAQAEPVAPILSPRGTSYLPSTRKVAAQASPPLMYLSLSAGRAPPFPPSHLLPPSEHAFAAGLRQK
ncbi:hypothetical protein CEXT_347601 [Caerostris extrusa]|uniref:Uncharacterized protein n=1 Tax=Caerostris extrusa TaxID=172846 RepID=A0AAV4S6W5_CAEEX|nr:hypothetical protein CEXT_347601 [Caerostris extrusa]